MQIEIYRLRNGGQTTAVIGNFSLPPMSYRFMALTVTERDSFLVGSDRTAIADYWVDAAFRPDGQLYRRYIGPPTILPVAKWVDYATGIECRSSAPATVVIHDGLVYAFTGDEPYTTGATFAPSKWTAVAIDPATAVATADAAQSAITAAEQAAASAAAALASEEASDSYAETSATNAQIAQQGGLLAASIPSFLGVDAWWSLRDTSSLYQTNDTSTPVTADGQTIGRITDKSGNEKHALQSTNSLRPIYKASPMHYARGDGVDDSLAVAMSLDSGFVAVLTRHGYMLAGEQNIGNAATWRLPMNDPSEVLVRSIDFTATEKSLLQMYFGVSQKHAVFVTYDSPIFHNIVGPSAPYQITYIGANGTVYQTSSNNTSVDVEAQGLTAPFAVIYPKSIQDDDTLTELRFNDNEFMGIIPSLSSTLTHLIAYGNALTGSLPATLPASLLQLDCNSNKLSGEIPTLPASLTLLNLATNQLTGQIPTLPATLTSLQVNDNSLTGNVPTIPASLATLYAQSNQLADYAGSSLPVTLGDVNLASNLLVQGAVDDILVQLAAAGKNSGTRLCNLGGSGNAIPSATGLTAKTTLEGLGWTVTVNS